MSLFREARKQEKQQQQKTSSGEKRKRERGVNFGDVKHDPLRDRQSRRWEEVQPSSAGVFLISGKVTSKIWQGGKFTLAEIPPSPRTVRAECQLSVLIARFTRVIVSAHRLVSTS